MSDVSWRCVIVIWVLLNLCANTIMKPTLCNLTENCIPCHLYRTKPKQLVTRVYSHTSGFTFTPCWLIERLCVIISTGSCWLSGIPGLPRVQKLQTTEINNLFKLDDSSVASWYIHKISTEVLRNGCKLACCSHCCVQPHRCCAFLDTELQTWMKYNCGDSRIF